MIVGVGLDLIEIERVAAVLAQHGEGFLDRILAPDEDRTRVRGPGGATHLAGLFAAKEAVMKALGTGMAGAAFKEIAIHHRPGGQPEVRLSGSAADRARQLGIGGWRISITHSRRAAAAVALGLSGRP